MIQEHLLRRNVKWFRGGLVLKSYRRLYHSTLGSSVINKKEEGQMGTYHRRQAERLDDVAMSNDYGTYKAVKATFWPLLSVTKTEQLSNCPLFARTRMGK